MAKKRKASINVQNTVLPHTFIDLLSKQLPREFSNLRMFKNGPGKMLRQHFYLKNTTLHKWEKANPYDYITSHCEHIHIDKRFLSYRIGKKC